MDTLTLKVQKFPEILRLIIPLYWNEHNRFLNGYLVVILDMVPLNISAHMHICKKKNCSFQNIV